MYESQRKDLVNTIKAKGIKDKNVLDAVTRVERHKFVPEALQSHSYRDSALPIGRGQTISQPYTVAFMTQAIEVEKGDRVLEIGTGSGYQAAILAEMGVKVFSIERDYEIYQRTQKLFDEMGIRATIKHGDGTIGWNEYAPYDGIIVTAGAPAVPESLKKQLASGGKLVIPVGDRNSQTLTVITKIGENDFRTEKFPEFVFVPLIGREGWES